MNNAWWDNLQFTAKTTPLPQKRKGAIRQSAIPPAVLKRLNQGDDETRSLVEWLAVDQGQLFKSVARKHRIQVSADLQKRVKRASNEKITHRLAQMGVIWAEILKKAPHPQKIFEILASEESDLVRTWGLFALKAEPRVSLPRRLQFMKIFATDRNMGVRECAWDGFRVYIASDLKKAITLLKPWTKNKNDAIRRCAIEGTRPRGVWTSHLSALKENPALGLPLLEPVKSDPSLYVRKAVANWMNDASKSKPRWVQETLKQWRKISPTKETEWIANRALRTLRQSKES